MKGSGKRKAEREGDEEVCAGGGGRYSCVGGGGGGQGEGRWEG